MNSKHRPASSLRRSVYLALEITGVTQPYQLVTRGVLIGVIVVVLSAVVLSTVPSLDARFGLLFDAIEWFGAIFFAIEYGLRVWVSVEDRDPRFSHPLFGRLRFMLTPMAIVDLLAFLPLFLDSNHYGHLVAIRLLRLVSLLKIMRYSPALRTLAMAIYTERRAALAVVLLMVITLTIVSTIMWMIEHEAQPEAFASIPAAMWWGIATLTTIGYGDVVPITPLGRVFGGLASMIGVAMFALPAAILASGFIREINRQGFRVTSEVVSKVPLFSRLDKSIIADLTARLHPRTVTPRYALVRRGETVHSLYFIEAGLVEVALPFQPVQTLGHGQIFGAVELVPGHERAAFAVTAITECRLLELPAPDFLALFRAYPQLRMAVLDAMRTADGALVFEGVAEAIEELAREEHSHIDADGFGPEGSL
jgi:voltage-gated potassium channel